MKKTGFVKLKSLLQTEVDSLSKSLWHSQAALYLWWHKITGYSPKVLILVPTT